MSAIPLVPRKRGRPLKGESASLRDDLILTSAKLFRTQGYERTTVRDIAAAVGIQAGSWFYHFKTKQDILVAVMEQGMASSLARIEALDVDNLSAREAFHALVRTHLKTMVSPDHDFIPVLLYEWGSLDQDRKVAVLKLKDRYEALWDSVIARLHASGEWLAPTPIDRLMTFGALNWAVQWYRPGGPLNLDELTDNAVQFLLRSVPAAGSAPAAKRPRKTKAG
ncbi:MULTISPECIES: TetR/AcrR family transcriptional regulator [Paraburkholderia]|uniref:TetR/AcrR family transcriptional regulator n=1 Tax=Paraburkholderia TaxID=1822464 RepID=UPI002257E3E5|nr:MULTISPECIES: TetR/AcrR family transcriptional regulator [Paraburkholderia]MCX4160989.1 TetR/AcrR family transcriptional regulator [Paraburkholderia megapolitana]MDN7156485.1 TetR/AcrR family transcriptional regulator [Paraburkholderia sp. CHISQ3]MDQ6493530.1 TetR/AcrR family transcriptional regulator [Paraburkholderia megapolitana]